MTYKTKRILNNILNLHGPHGYGVKGIGYIIGLNYFFIFLFIYFILYLNILTSITTR